MIAVLGSLNTDLVFNLPRLPEPGETVQGKSFKVFPGGKGANQAVAAARMKVPTEIFGVVGDDANGDFLGKAIAEAGVNVAHLLKDPVAPTGVAAIMVDSLGNNSIAVSPGANFSSQESLLQNFLSNSRSKTLLFQLEIPAETVFAAIKELKSQAKWMILNPAPASALPEEILTAVDILTPNESELALICGSTNLRPEPDAVKNMARELISRGLKHLIVTLGPRGVLYLDSLRPNEPELFPAFKVHASDTTAAGDCFNGVLAAGLDQGLSIREAILPALKAAAISVTRAGAQPSMPEREEVERFFD